LGERGTVTAENVQTIMKLCACFFPNVPESRVRQGDSEQSPRMVDEMLLLLWGHFSLW
jgi:hypothetical protein